MYDMLRRGLCERVSADDPIRVGLVGAGKFGVGLAVQLASMQGIRLATAADLDLERARHAYTAVGIPSTALAVAEHTTQVSEAVARRQPCVTQNAQAVIACEEIEIVVEATGSPGAGAAHAAAAIAHGKHVVMVNVEADVTVGAILRRQADQAGVVYTLVDGDQPGAIMNLVNWAQLLGFRIVAAGRGTIMRADDRAGTPDTVPQRYGFTAAQMARRTINPQMYNSFRDGTKAQIEMTAVANMTGLVPDIRGMHEPTVTLEDMPTCFSLTSEGGILQREGVVELANSVAADGRSLVPNTLRMGVFAVIQTDHPYTQEDLLDYMGCSGGDGRNFLLYRPYHLVAVTAPLTLLRAVLLHEPTGRPRRIPCAEVVTVAKTELGRGTLLDGGGGYTVVGLSDTTERAQAEGLVPLGLCRGGRLTRAVPAGTAISRDMVELDTTTDLYALRQAQDRLACQAGDRSGSAAG